MKDSFLKKFRQLNADRCKTWMPYSHRKNLILHHLVGISGEVGELCNIIKKLDRGDMVQTESVEQHITDEIADIFIYLDLIADLFDIDLQDAVTKKFNETSVKHDLPQRIEEEVTMTKEEISYTNEEIAELAKRIRRRKNFD
jgi:NTP pyrophosphatase (non-canonical NTP hydrolase)